MDNPYEAPIQSDSIVAAPDVRPVTATVFGVLNLVLGLWGMCGGIFGGAFMLVIASGVLENEGFGNLDQFQNPIYQSWMVFSMVVSFFLQALLVGGGVGLLKFKPWGRTLSNYYAIPSILLVIIGLGMEFGFALLPAMERMQDVAGPERAGLIGGTIGGLIGGCFGMLYPVALLFFMNRSPFKEQIRGH